jgi:hypothetical protein
MKRFLPITLTVIAVAALSWVVPRAQGTSVGQKPPETKAKAEGQAKGDTAKQVAPAQAKPPEIAPEDYPPDFKAFNEAAKEKDAQKRTAAYEKFVADFPDSILVSMARSEVQSSLLATVREARKKYLDLVKAQIDAAKARDVSVTNLYQTYNSFASAMLNSGLFLEEAEEYGRTGLSLMDEKKYIDTRKQSAERAAAAAAKAAANPKPADAAPPAPAASAVTGVSMSITNGVMVAKPIMRQPASPSATPRPPPRIPADEELRAAFLSDKVSAQATLGQVLLKRGKTAEAEQLLKEAYAGKPASYTLATIARVLAESAKKAGDEKAQVEYSTALALTGQMSADERKDFEAAYRKSHAGSLDGLEEMLDERYRAEYPKLEVTPYVHNAASGARTVLAELFAGSG